MRRDLLPLLACPDCRGALELEGDDTSAEVVGGSLRCRACGTAFPIEDGIPRLLPSADRTRRQRASR